MTYSTDQENFWAGEFGTDYISRNRSPAGRTGIFARILARTSGIKSAIELGANIGLNLRAIKNLLPECELVGVEINKTAFEELKKIPGVIAWNASLIDFELKTPSDLSFTSGVLIHLNPDLLPRAYNQLYHASRRYIVIFEYYNPTPVEVNYRGHFGHLFKRDWAGEMMDKFPDLQLLDYGFFYHRAPIFAADDATWFLFEKR